jgi:outer membrane biogenesis lipoprotein LolB
LTGRTAALALAVALAGCALAPPSQAPLPRLSAVPASFEMSGRLALRQGDRSEIARLRWTHSPASDRWVIASPIGNEVARIESGAAGAKLTRAGGEPEEAASFAALTERLLGVALEPATLAGWLHGAVPRESGDWAVSIDESQRAGEVEMARRLTARRGEVTVRLVVDEYRSLETPP